MTIPVPIHGSQKAAAAWLSASGVNPDVFVPRQSPVFSENSFAQGKDELENLWMSGADVSWLGGPAVASVEWPRNANGQPLEHVATFHLADVHSALGEPSERGWPEDAVQLLPDHGFLQVFHDLQTYGYEPEDAEARGWMISWTPEQNRDTRQPFMEIDGESAAPTEVTQLGLFMPGWTIPSVLDITGLDQSALDAADEVMSQLGLAWLTQRYPDDTHTYAIPATRFLGHSWTEDQLPKEEVLPQTLPLDVDGDDHVLLVEIESWTTLSGWFGDASSLEVWMRRSDLQARRFENCWCMIRTD